MIKNKKKLTPHVNHSFSCFLTIERTVSLPPDDCDINKANLKSLFSIATLHASKIRLPVR